MILDYIKRVEQYDGVWPNLVEAIRFAEGLGNPELGRYEIGDSFALVQEIQTVHATEKDFELHRKYVDVHIILEGEELLEYEDIDNLSPIGTFNDTRDIQMASGKGQSVIIRPGMFCLVFPHDGHKPGCCVTNPSVMKKIVLKIPGNF